MVTGDDARLSPASRHELAARWAYRATLEQAAARRFTQLAARMAAVNVAPALVAIAELAAAQEHAHVALCAQIAATFSDQPLPAPAPDQVHEVAPPAWSPSERAWDRVLYEVVAFCCVCETANAAVVTAGYDDVLDPEVQRAVQTILADEVEHSRLGWRFLATYPPDEAQRAWLAEHLADMLEGTIRADLFAPGDDGVVGDEAMMQRYGTLPIAGRRAAFLGGMREVLLPGLAAYGVDVAPAAAWLEALERQLG